MGFLVFPLRRRRSLVALPRAASRIGQFAPQKSRQARSGGRKSLFHVRNILRKYSPKSGAKTLVYTGNYSSEQATDPTMAGEATFCMCAIFCAVDICSTSSISTSQQSISGKWYSVALFPVLYFLKPANNHQTEDE